MTRLGQGSLRSLASPNPGYTPLKLGKHRLRDECRAFLSIPIGIPLFMEPCKAKLKFRLLMEDFDPPITATVGDFVTFNIAVKGGVAVKIAVVDGKTLRIRGVDTEVIEKIFEIVLTCENPPGYITPSAIRALEKAVELTSREHKSVLVLVRGEEDLLFLPLVLMLPNKSLIAYGLWRGALVVAPVSSYLKRSVAGCIRECFVCTNGNS